MREPSRNESQGHFRKAHRARNTATASAMVSDTSRPLLVLIPRAVLLALAHPRVAVHALERFAEHSPHAPAISSHTSRPEVGSGYHRDGKRDSADVCAKCLARACVGLDDYTAAGASNPIQGPTLGPTSASTSPGSALSPRNL